MRPPQAFATYFGAESAPLFGWFHGAGVSAGLGVVLCSPFGCEEISAHRSWRSLADKVSRAGFPVLRFDLACSGDSAGSMLDDDVPAQWLASVHAAVDELRRLSGVSRVVLVGLRSGAMLAWQAARERADVAALACVVPVLSGRAWLRELKALEAAAQGDVMPSPEGMFESGGFAMSEAARAHMSEIDLRKVDRFPSVPMLLVDRSELPMLERWANDLATGGVPVQHRLVSGFTELMLAPHRAVVPESMWSELLGWLSSLPVETVAVRQDAAALTRRSVEWNGVREEVIDFPVPQGQLNAIVSTSATGLVSGHTLLLLNAGATRRIGPSRIHVDLARQWARLGHCVVRLDLSGLGDSAPLQGRPDTVVYSPSAVQEVCSVVELLRAQPGTVQVHLMGLCAGAYHGFKAAVQGARVDSVVAINPLTFFWNEGMSLDAPLAAHKVVDDMNRYRKGLLDASRWRKLLAGGVDLTRLLAVLWHAEKAVVARPWRELARVLHLPLRDDLAAELLGVTRRGVKLNFLIASGDPGETLLREQGGRAVDRLAREGALTIERFEDADHVFTRHRARQSLARALTRLFAADAARR